MAKIGKRIREATKLVVAEKQYSLDEAIEMIGAYSKKFKAKFDESVEIALRLGVDPKQSDQLVPGAVAMPNGLGKTIKVGVFCEAERVKEAKDAGADVYGAEDFIDIVKTGKIEFDVAIATPSMMIHVSKLGKVLGPRGLMPNPKLGTVSNNIKEAVGKAKAGQVEFKVEKAGIVHAAVGKVSFAPKAIKENILALYDAVLQAKPTGAKGIYMQGIFVSTSMGPSIRLDMTKVMG
jgi:large subunit ribosomal protein L1